jgi:uncharacterized sodium:solute symporter family permease YidK
MNTLDWTLIAASLMPVSGLGIAAGFLRRRNERGGAGGHYFLAGNTLAWPVIGLAMFAANISTVHLVSLAEAAYKFGLVFGNFEWMAGFTLILLSLFFAPRHANHAIYFSWQIARKSPDSTMPGFQFYSAKNIEDRRGDCGRSL